MMYRIVSILFVFGLLTNLPIKQPVIAQEQAVPSFTIDHIALSVQDAGRSVAFYKRVLGLNEIVNRTEVDGIRWLSLGEGKELHLISVVKKQVKINKAVHFAVTTSDFGGFLAILKTHNINYSSWQGDAGVVTVRADNTRQLYIQDIDGYWVEINSVASD